MKQKTPGHPAAAPAQAGIDPRNALDILDIRTTRQSRTGIAELAAHDDAGPDVLHYLATHGAPATRAAVAANLSAAATTNRLLADDEAEEVRVELALKIARLMPGLSEREGSQIVALTIETLECLARDSAARVRAVLAEAVKALDCIPRDVARTLARDLDAAVAVPILQYSPLLSDADLIEVIACGQVRAALSAIAGRKPVSEAVGAALVHSLDVPAVAALLVNPQAHIRKDTMDRIIEQAEAIQAWHMPLALRADLSARAIRRIGALVGAAILEQLAARHDISDETRIRLNRELRARLAEKEMAAETATPAEAVALAAQEGRLDGLFVEQAVQAGRREQVVLALTQLASVTDQTVRRILASGSAKPVVALVWHAHLSMRVAFKIQTMLLKLPAREVLPARGGVGFPMSKDEMRWHLTYFNIPV